MPFAITNAIDLSFGLTNQDIIFSIFISGQAKKFIIHKKYIRIIYTFLIMILSRN